LLVDLGQTLPDHVSRFGGGKVEESFERNETCDFSWKNQVRTIRKEIKRKTMKKLNIVRPLFGLTLTLVGLMSWNTLPIHLPERTVQAATRARVTEPTGQAVSRAAVNGRIAFVSSEGNAQSDIYTMNPDGSDRKQLTFSQESEGQPVWSPDGTKIAFVRYNSNFGEIFVMNADGTNQMRTSNPIFQDFDWSPDSTRIVFESIHDRSVSISVMNADGSNVQRLTPGVDFSPKWSPDGTKIAFVRTEDYWDGAYNISVINADGTNQTQLSNRQGYDPRWSPDGTKIVFVGMFESSHEICVMKTDGSNLQRLTNNPEYDSWPKWSPDGSKITFTNCGGSNGFGCSGTPHIWVVNADGSNPTQLADILAYGSAWSPDGTKIIFGGANSGAAELFVMNPDGSGLTNITNTPDRVEYSPSWQALPLTLPNPIDDPQFFVRQHYLDFLSREPDPAGLAFWTNEIAMCGGDVRCVEVKRINVSAAFYLSIEFQQTGYLVERLYKAAYGDALGTSTFGGAHQLPVPWVGFSEFLPDTQRIGQRVVVGQGNWQQQLEDNKNAFAAEFVQRAQFATAFPTSMTPAQFVDKLFQNTGVSPSGTERNTAINEFSGAGDTSNLTARSKALCDVAENATLTTNEFNRAFVLMQYFGYMRRNPNDPQDTDYTGYDFWLTKLNNFTVPGDDVLVRVQNADMVKAFITSTEYRQRFGP
jgi:Tol biopolymer transport system component